MSEKITRYAMHGLIGAILSVTGACSPASYIVRHEASLMDVSVVYQVPASEPPLVSAFVRQSLNAHADRVWPLIDVYNPESEISRANQIAARNRFPISRDTWRVLDHALRLSNATGGAFDITAATLTHLWRAHWNTAPDTALPEPLIEAARMGIGAGQIDLQNQSLFYRSERTQLDINEFARAYVLDLSIIQLRRQGGGDLLIQVGNSARCLGHADEQENWSVPLTHPFDATVTLGHMILPDSAGMSVMSMADQAMILDGQRVARLIDPRTGRPAHGTALTAVTGATATESYALAKALFIDGLVATPKHMQAFPRYQALVIPDTEPLEIWITPEMTPFFQPDPEWAASVRVMDTEREEVRAKWEAAASGKKGTEFEH